MDSVSLASLDVNPEDADNNFNSSADSSPLNLSDDTKKGAISDNGKVDTSGDHHVPISGGRLKFFLDGKFVLELSHQGDLTHTQSHWTQVTKRTYWPPLQVSSQPNPAVGNQNSPEDSSSVQSSPVVHAVDCKRKQVNLLRTSRLQSTFVCVASEALKIKRRGTSVKKLLFKLHRRPYIDCADKLGALLDSSVCSLLTEGKGRVRRNGFKKEKKPLMEIVDCIAKRVESVGICGLPKDRDVRIKIEPCNEFIHANSNTVTSSSCWQPETTILGLQEKGNTSPRKRNRENGRGSVDSDQHVVTIHKSPTFKKPKPVATDGVVPNQIGAKDKSPKGKNIATVAPCRIKAPAPQVHPTALVSPSASSNEATQTLTHSIASLLQSAQQITNGGSGTRDRSPPSVTAAGSAEPLPVSNGLRPYMQEHPGMELTVAESLAPVVPPMMAAAVPPSALTQFIGSQIPPSPFIPAAAGFVNFIPSAFPYAVPGYFPTFPYSPSQYIGPPIIGGITHPLPSNWVAPAAGFVNSAWWQFPRMPAAVPNAEACPVSTESKHSSTLPQDLVKPKSEIMEIKSVPVAPPAHTGKNYIHSDQDTAEPLNLSCRLRKDN